MANSPKRAAASTQVLPHKTQIRRGARYPTVKKAQPVDEVMVKLQQTSRLVGKGGSIVNQMQEESGARINISRNEEVAGAVAGTREKDGGKAIRAANAGVALRVVPAFGLHDARLISSTCHHNTIWTRKGHHPFFLVPRA